VFVGCLGGVGTTSAKGGKRNGETLYADRTLPDAYGASFTGNSGTSAETASSGALLDPGGATKKRDLSLYGIYRVGSEEKTEL
jgi:hypothetical protein